MTAKQAHERTTTILENRMNEAYKKAIERIETAISDGKFYVTAGGHLPDIVVNQLRQDGFEVSNESQYNEPYHTIKW